MTKVCNVCNKPIKDHDNTQLLMCGLILNSMIRNDVKILEERMDSLVTRCDGEERRMDLTLDRMDEVDTSMADVVCSIEGFDDISEEIYEVQKHLNSLIIKVTALESRREAQDRSQTTWDDVDVDVDTGDE